MARNDGKVIFVAIQFGVDQLISEGAARRRGVRIGLVTSDVARASRGQSSRVALLSAGFNIVRLFSPEHGLGGVAEDGVAVDDARDEATALPVVSLYGQRLRPPAESITDLDALMFDIPDVGARFYTYIWTLSQVMEACAEAGKPVWVLDRPNPIGGVLADAEGPGLDEQNLSSFVGRWDIPVRYSLTIGELARLWNAQRKLDVELHVARLSGWRRDMHWPETGIEFTPMSPAMTSYETALFYPGTCLIEGTQLSEGRGTDSPFRMIGAPWIDGATLASAMNALRLPGVRFEPARFTPGGRKFADQECQGVKLHATDPRALRPVNLGLNLIAQIIKHWPEEFQWLPYPTAANTRGLQHFDRLIGRLDIREALERGVSREQIDAWTRCDGWAGRAKPHLLYE